MTKNEKAFLDMIAHAEIGPALLQESNDGYNVIVGSRPGKAILFYDYSDHPRILIKKMNSTAAGRYQILKRYFDAYKKTLKLRDFSPPSQDAIAMQMIREQGALKDVIAGRFEEAVKKVRNIWASMPGAGYGQRELAMGTLKAVFIAKGGTVEDLSVVV